MTGRKQIAASTLESLLVGIATPIGFRLGLQLLDASSPARQLLDELAGRARAIAGAAREAWIRRQVERMHYDAALYLTLHEHETTTETETKENES